MQNSYSVYNDCSSFVGLCSVEYCCSGLCNSTSSDNQQCIHDADKPPCDGKIDTRELTDYINEWKNNQDLTIAQILQVVNLWKSGGQGKGNVQNKGDLFFVLKRCKRV